jgi:hypothetical protein
LHVVGIAVLGDRGSWAVVGGRTDAAQQGTRQVMNQGS